VIELTSSRFVFFRRSGWKTNGCATTASNATHTECQCSHLTHFGVLVDVNDVDLAPEHWVALTVITCAGCVVSIIALAAAFLTFTFVPSLKVRYK
jgi:G protein-coupled receptor 112